MNFIGEKYYHVTNHDRKIIELEVISEESIGSDNYGTEEEPKMCEWFEVEVKPVTDFGDDRSVELELESMKKRYFSIDLNDRNGLHRSYADAKAHMIGNIERSISYKKDELRQLEDLLKNATSL